MTKKTFKNIENAEIAAKGVISLSDRPNVASSYGVGGLTPTQLKLWFDKLGTLLADRLNTLQTALAENGQDYIGISTLGESITCLGDLTASLINGSFATTMLAYHSAASMGDENNLATLQSIINEKARLISELTEALSDYKIRLKSSYGAYEVGLSIQYGGEGKTINDLINDIYNCVLSTKITLLCQGFESGEYQKKEKALDTFALEVAEVLRCDKPSGMLSKILERYTTSEVDKLLESKVDKTKYQNDKTESASRITALEKQTSTINDNIGDMSNIDDIGADIALAIKSLNEDVDSLQLGVKPRILRGVVLWATPETLDSALVAELNKKVYESTGRSTPDNTDSVQAWDNEKPNAGKMYTYHYWSSEVIGSDLDGWYLASIYTSPMITEIPSYVMNIRKNTWTENPDSKGLYYIEVQSATHGVGTDMTLYVDLRRKNSDGTFASCNLFTVSTNGTVYCYTDEKFEGKLIIRVGKAYYTANTTDVDSVEIEEVNGLEEILAEKVTASGGEVGDTVATFEDIAGTAANLQSGNTLKVLFGKVKNWFSRLKALAFKDKVGTEDMAEGTVCPNANYATNASHATTADSSINATNANYATTAGSATTAITADSATTAGSATNTDFTNAEWILVENADVGETNFLVDGAIYEVVALEIGSYTRHKGHCIIHYDSQFLQGLSDNGAITQQISSTVAVTNDLIRKLRHGIIRVRITKNGQMRVRLVVSNISYSENSGFYEESTETYLPFKYRRIR